MKVPVFPKISFATRRYFGFRDESVVVAVGGGHRRSAGGGEVFFKAGFVKAAEVAGAAAGVEDGDEAAEGVEDGGGAGVVGGKRRKIEAEALHVGSFLSIKERIFSRRESGAW